MSNEITAYFKGRAGVSESLYQYDYGMVLNLDGIELPSSFECYFDTTGSDEAIPAIGTDSRVAIPNDCLSRPGDVTLHIPLHSGVNDSQVEYVVKFRVIGRARPVDGGTPEQQTAIEQALALLQNPIGNIEQIVNEALAFTGDTFAEMQEQLDADQAAFQSDIGDRADAFEAEIRSDISDVESDFSNLNAQFQTAIGAVTVDDELLNVRVGDDNVTYATAGEAVRKQFSQVKSDTQDKVDEFSVVRLMNKGTTNGGAYSYVTKGFFSNSGYKYAVIEANSLDKVYVTAMSGESNVPIAMFYKDEPLDSTNWIGYYGSLSEKIQYTNELLSIPSGTKYIAINCRAEGTFMLKRAIPNNGLKIIASYDSDTSTLSMLTRYTPTSSLKLTMGKTGGNNLFDFIRFEERNDDGSYEFYINNTTDWFSPYKIRAKSNADGDLPDGWYGHFVGGNHQYNNVGTGSSPTARCVIDKVLFDNETATSTEKQCSSVDVYWTNYVQGQNTKKADGTGREILMEKYHMHYDGDSIQINHCFMPLEDILIFTYYGLACWWANANAPTVQYKFIGGTNRIIHDFPASSEVTSGDKKCSAYYVIDSDNNKIQLSLKSTDIGEGQMNATEYSAFASARKLYFNLVNNNPAYEINANEYYYYDGEIRIYKDY